MNTDKLDLRELTEGEQPNEAEALGEADEVWRNTVEHERRRAATLQAMLDDDGPDGFRTTNWAYEQVCAARDKHQQRAEQADLTIERLDGMLRLALHTDWSEYDCNGVPEVPDETRLAELARRYAEQKATP